VQTYAGKHWDSGPGGGDIDIDIQSNRRDRTSDDK
jgi:hypothetical protein